MKKSIGILTMQRGVNYGSFLQAFALQSVIKELGYESRFIEMAPGIPLISRYKIIIPRLVRNLKRVFLYNKHLPTILNWNRNLTNTIVNDGLKYFGIDDVSYLKHDKFDLIVIGSDEVFNCMDLHNGYRPQLLGKGLNCNRLISYAASCGYTTVDMIQEFNLIDDVSSLLKSFDDISVRDKNSLNVVKKLDNDRSTIISLDPVLIYNFEEHVSKSRYYPFKYLLLFSYLGRFDKHKDEVTAILKYAKKYNLKIVSLYSYLTWADYNPTPSSFDVLSLFRDAECVFTDTFHGAIMSIKYNKQFLVSVRTGNKNKLGYLLEKFDLTSRIIDSSKSAIIQMDDPIDYDTKNKLIFYESERSREYLLNNILKS